MTIKTLYISDLDGTLLNSEKEVSEFTKATINALIADGVHFSIATARTAASVVKILTGVNINIPVVLMNGAVIYDINQHKYIKTEVISTKTANAIIGVLKEYNISGFMYAITNDNLITYYENLNTSALKDFHDERVMKYYKSFEQVNDFFEKVIDNEIIYFALIDEFERLSVVLNVLKNNSDIDMVLYKDIYAEDLWYLEVFGKNASKYNAVKYLREYCKYDKIIGFGDNLNDIPLFKACDEGYAVSNAMEELKEMATGLIDDNNNDGVARFVIKHSKG